MLPWFPLAANQSNVVNQIVAHLHLRSLPSHLTSTPIEQRASSSMANLCPLTPSSRWTSSWLAAWQWILRQGAGVCGIREGERRGVPARWASRVFVHAACSVWTVHQTAVCCVRAHPTSTTITIVTHRDALPAGRLGEGEGEGFAVLCWRTPHHPTPPHTHLPTTLRHHPHVHTHMPALSARRLGKGEGFAELEWGLLAYMKAVDDSTLVVTTVRRDRTSTAWQMELLGLALLHVRPATARAACSPSCLLLCRFGMSSCSQEAASLLGRCCRMTFRWTSSVRPPRCVRAAGKAMQLCLELPPAADAVLSGSPHPPPISCTCATPPGDPRGAAGHTQAGGHPVGAPQPAEAIEDSGFAATEAAHRGGAG